MTATFALRGTRGTWRHPLSFHVARVALGDIRLRFAWQAWHSWHCVARLDDLVAGDAATLWQAWHLVTSTFVFLDRGGTCRHRPLLCVQAWHLWHCVARFQRETFRCLFSSSLFTCDECLTFFGELARSLYVAESAILYFKYFTPCRQCPHVPFQV